MPATNAGIGTHPQPRKRSAYGIEDPIDQLIGDS
jgi:hypothetical protein